MVDFSFLYFSIGYAAGIFLIIIGFCIYDFISDKRYRKTMKKYYQARIESDIEYFRKLHEKIKVMNDE